MNFRKLTTANAVGSGNNNWDMRLMFLKEFFDAAKLDKSVWKSLYREMLKTFVIYFLLLLIVHYFFGLNMFRGSVNSMIGTLIVVFVVGTVLSIHKVNSALKSKNK